MPDGAKVAALEAAAATSGRAVLISGVTVMIAMAGMFLSGDKTFMSFSIGTMMVVLVAMIGSLTVLPALLGRLGDKIEKGRVPFLHRLKSKDGEGRLWGAILDRVLRRPLVSFLAASAVLLALIIPAFQLNTAATTVEDISIAEIEPARKFTKAFEGGQEPAVVAIKAADTRAEPVQEAIATLKAKALASDQMSGPIDIETSRDSTVTTIDDPARRQGHRRRVGRRTRDAAERLRPADDRSGGRRRVRGRRRHRRRQGLERQDDDDGTARLRLRAPVRVHRHADLVPVDRDRSQVDRAQPAVGRSRLRRARGGLPVGLGREPVRLPVERRHHAVAADVPVRDPVRALDGLPRVHPQPDQGGSRPRALDRRLDPPRDQDHGRAS